MQQGEIVTAVVSETVVVSAETAAAVVEVVVTVGKTIRRESWRGISYRVVVFGSFRVIVERARGVPREGRGGMGGGRQMSSGRSSSSRGPPRGSDK